jgi:hypothetical protein
VTTTPLDYFDKTPGTLEQLVLGVITQKLINRDYIHESLATDFTTNAISYAVTLDSGDNGAIDGNLSLSLTFPTIPFERQILVDKSSYDLRILSLNSLNIDTLSLPQKPDYPAKSVLAQLPEYLSLDVPDNILERRLLALCLHIRNYLNWIERWNNVANYWIMNTVSGVFYSTYPLADIEADRDALLVELASGVTYKIIPPDRIYYPPPSPPEGNPSTAQELIVDFASTGISDPASGNGSSLSSDLVDALLSASQSSGGFGGNQPDSPDSQPNEVPTLPNC